MQSIGSETDRSPDVTRHHGQEGADARGNRSTHSAPAGLWGLCLGGRRSGQHVDPLDPADRREPYYICGGCGISVREIHSWTERRIRDLPWGTWTVWLNVEVHRVRCRRCGVRTERLPFVAGKAHYTARLEAAVAQACEAAPVKPGRRPAGPAAGDGPPHGQARAAPLGRRAPAHAAALPGGGRDLPGQDGQVPDCGQ